MDSEGIRAVCRDVERLEGLVSCPSPEWPPRRTPGSLSVHIKARLQRIRTGAARMADPTAAATLDRAVEAASAWQQSIRPPAPKPITLSRGLAAAASSDVPPAARSTVSAPSPDAVPPASSRHESGKAYGSMRPYDDGQRTAAAAVCVLGVCLGGALLLRARRKVPAAVGSRSNVRE